MSLKIFRISDVACSSASIRNRETREGWPLLTVETEANRDSKSTNERGPSLVVRLSLHASTKGFSPSVAALFSPIQNILFFTVHYFNSFVRIAQQAGQAVVQGRLSLNVCPLRKIVTLKSIHLPLSDVAH